MARQPDEPPKDYLARIIASTAQVQSQMTRRTGHLYELSKKNSGLINTAWRAAGSLRGPAGSSLRRDETGQWVRVETPEWRAWRSWIRQRERLRREHGMRGSGGVHYGGWLDDCRHTLPYALTISVTLEL